MNKSIISLTINHESDIPKYQQLVNAINDAIGENILQKGDALPSVNKICKMSKLSRDTVFKAYSILKENGVIESVPNKGYYVANETKKVLLLLDTFKAYKEVLYHSFVNNLPDNIITDVQFHHYNIDNFKTILNNAAGKYYKYVVMTFNNDEVPSVLADIDNDKLLLIDWSVHSNTSNNYVFQDFGNSFYEALKEAVDVFRKYKELVFLYPTYTYHPIETITYFKKYCELFQFKYQIVTDPNAFSLQKDAAYISTSDRMLGVFLEQCKIKNLEPGVDVGFLSYNETPMKKFIYKGISVISTDFKELGTKAAEFVLQEKPMQYYVPTKLIIRESL
ncbi:MULTISPECIES: GntR family transcriptional regulator [Polaribacter]|uniref:GntR family transcriptional regulator n=1 Tax=Polaribacter sejongensis TaxID=985043 RepID=A0AAJ1QTW1_9FLAO|nr:MULTISPECIES: GntR family transcriptional regulator [Polaribacter]AUC23612.1 GntR family transcriptional regulator [Polaribacter sejongensis]MDN3617840.1 GntR family transcriptional regulator [Polaribacter undariae]UWD32163.1 GntR family transcriptional regulator [Polaribacter undariae]